MPDTSLYKSIASADEQAYDVQVKKLFSHKEILARIMKECVEEYKDCSIDDIANKYIEGIPQIDLPVDREDAALIHGLNTEDKTASEGTVLYDIRFNAIAPGEKDEYIQLIINVEAQKSDSPGYSLIRRGIYYCGRMLSAEKNVDFEKSNYNHLKKVYSIWICYESADASNTMTRFRMTKEDMVGLTRIDQREYDLLQLVMIRLGDPSGAKLGSILHMLDTIFSEDEELSDKKKILEADYGLKMTEPMSEEMNIMCNISQGIKEKAWDGGRAEGRAEGIAQGMEKGIAQGAENALKVTALNLLKLGLPLEKIVAAVNRPEQVVSEWLKSTDLSLN